MAGDWIPIETDLTTQQKVLVMSGLMSVSPFEIVGRLCHFWSWFTSQQVVELDDQSGAIVGAYRDGVIDVGATSPEMFNALESVGWLRTGEVDGKPSLIVPRYGSWLAKCSKARKQKAQRQRRWREGKREAPTETRTETRKKTSFVESNVDASKRGKVKGKSKKEAPIVPATLISWCEWWNVLHGQSLVRASVNASTPSEAIQAAWRRVKRSNELRQLLSDRTAIRGALESSSFCRRGWFTLPKLLGAKNKEGELVIEKLLSGGYRDDDGTTQSTVASGGRLRGTDWSKLPTRTSGDNATDPSVAGGTDAPIPEGDGTG